MTLNILSHEESGPNDHLKDALPFIFPAPFEILSKIKKGDLERHKNEMKNDFEEMKTEMKGDFGEVLKELKDRDQLLKTVETLKMEKQQLMEKLAAASTAPKQFDQECYLLKLLLLSIKSYSNIYRHFYLDENVSCAIEN